MTLRNLVWHVDVLNRMRVNAWKVASRALATMLNKCHRHLARRATCPACGKADEDSFHALVTCDKATVLWHAMNEVWPIPPKELVNSGGEWFLHLLHLHSSEVRDMIVMLIWRI